MTDIKGKIEKLLRLAAKAGTPEEAAAASAKAAELALAHNIDLNAVGSSDTIKLEHEFADPGSVQRWMEWIATAVAEINACRALLNHDGRIRFVGRMGNAMNAKVQFEYLVEAVNRLNREAVAGKGFSKEQRKAHRHSFRLGAASALSTILKRRYNELRTAGLKDQPQANALVVASYFDQEQAAIDEGIGERTQSRKRTPTQVNQDIFMKGADAATRINLASQVDNRPETKKITTT